MYFSKTSNEFEFDKLSNPQLKDVSEAIKVVKI